MPYKKLYKKTARFVKKRVYKPYTQLKGGRGRANRMKLYNEVQQLKKAINAEKKRIDDTATSNTAIGQVIQNTAGYYVNDITPIPASGSGYSQRSGASIKLTASHFIFQLTSQSALVSPMKVIIELYLIKGTPYGSPVDFVNAAFEATPFVGGASIIDYNSQYDPDKFGTWTKLKSKKIFFNPVNYSGQKMIRTVHFGIKYNKGQGHHIRFSDDTTTIMNGQLLLLVRSDSGNAHSSSASTLTGIPVTAVNTGFTINWDINHYYYDN